MLYDQVASRYGMSPSQLRRQDSFDTAFDVLCYEAGLKASAELAKSVGAIPALPVR